jgi:hypothetical protein
VPRDASGKRSDRISRAGEPEACRSALGNDREHFAMAERIYHRIGTFKGDEDAVHVDHLGNCRDRFACVDQQNDSLSGSHVELAPLVGEHESPVEILADYEAEQDTGLGLRCHGAVRELTVAIVIGLAAPHARSEGATVALCRQEESHD